MTERTLERARAGDEDAFRDRIATNRCRNAPGGAPSRPRPPAGARPRSAREVDLTRRFAEAFAADDVDGVVALLTRDAWLTMPPAGQQYQGAAAIAAFLRASAAWRAGRRFWLLPTRANTQPAFACYLPDAEGPGAQAAGLVVLTLEGERIAAVTRFLDSQVFRPFALPETLRA